MPGCRRGRAAIMPFHDVAGYQPAWFGQMQGGGGMPTTGLGQADDRLGRALSPLEHRQFDALVSADRHRDRLGRGGARTVARFVTGLYVDTSGPHASLYTAGNGNIVTGNPTLSIAALNTAWGILRNMRDADGEPIMVEAAVLVVPPSLEVTARNILNATQVFATVAGGAAGQELQIANWIGASLTMAIDPYIPLAATVANGATSWFLFAAPSVARPALEVGFVRGWQEPVLYQKQANTIRIGGGVDQTAGDFGTMSQEYKGVLAFGGARLDARATVASNGSNVA